MLDAASSSDTADLSDPESVVAYRRVANEFRDADAVALLSCKVSSSTRARLIEVLNLVVACSAHVLGLRETRHPEGGIVIGLRPLLVPPTTSCISLLLFRLRLCGAVVVVVARLCCCFAYGPGMRLQSQPRRRLRIFFQSGAVWLCYGPLKQTELLSIVDRTTALDVLHDLHVVIPVTSLERSRMPSCLGSSGLSPSLDLPWWWALAHLHDVRCVLAGPDPPRVSSAGHFSACC